MDNLNQPHQAQEVQSQTPSPINKSSNTKLLILVLACVAIVLAIGAYVLGSKQTQQPVVQNQQNSAAPTAIPTPVDETANWKTYTNITWNYQFQYPPTWIPDELDMEHVVITSPDIKKSTDGRIVKFPEIYIRVNVIKRENIASSFEEEIKAVYTESPQCSVGSDCPLKPPQITKKTNTNSLEYYFLTTGVYNNELAIFSLPKDKNRYVLIDSRKALVSNIKLPDQILATFKFTQ